MLFERCKSSDGLDANMRERQEEQREKESRRAATKLQASVEPNGKRGCEERARSEKGMCEDGKGQQ